MKTMETVTIWNVVEHLETVDDMVDYLDAAFETNEPQLIAVAHGDIEKAVKLNLTKKERRLIYLALF